jgi:hypothetical protein
MEGIYISGMRKTIKRLIMVYFTKAQMQITISNIKFFVGIFSVISLASCASLSKGPTQFEQFALSFSEAVNKVEWNIDRYSEFVKELSNYEKYIGNLSDSDYNRIDELLSAIPEVRKETDLQLQNAKDIGRSVTNDGYYINSGKKVGGWDNVAHTNLHIEANINTLDHAYIEVMENYRSIDLNLLKKPNKPFNANITKIMMQINIEITSAKSDVVVKDWTSGKNAIDRANNAIKDALKLELNDVEQYQMALIQDELKKVSSDISLGSTLNKAGSLIEEGASGAIDILGGVGDILKGLGKKINK